MHTRTFENTSINDYINNKENILKIEIVNTVNNNESKFLECPLHTPENPHLKMNFVQK